MKRFFVLILILALTTGCADLSNNLPPESKGPTYADTLAMLDTAYKDPASGYIMPPCSMTPTYCKCMIHRGADSARVPECR